MGTDRIAKFSDESSCDTPQFASTELFRITHNTAFRATEGQVDHGGLPGHECSECRDLGLGYVRMIANTTLARSAYAVVQNAKTMECTY